MLREKNVSSTFTEISKTVLLQFLTFKCRMWISFIKKSAVAAITLEKGDRGKIN